MQNITETSDTTEIDIKTWFVLMEQVLNEDSSWPHLLLPVIMFFLFVIGLVGNLLTCLVIYYDKTMHTATNYYLFDLAVTDLLVSIAILLEVHEHFGTDYHFLNYSFGDLTCKIHFFLVVSLWNNGILIMTALATERYVAVCHPLMLKSAPVWKRVTKVIVVIWVVAIAETLPEIWTVGLIQSRKASMCFIVPTPYAKVVNGVLAMVTFILPLGIMTFMYVMIAFQINVVQKTTQKTRMFNHKNNRSKVNKLITLTLSFLICWLPFFFIRISIFAWDAKQLMKMDKAVNISSGFQIVILSFQWWHFWYKISCINCWFSAVLNPLLYSVISTKFRQSLKMLWRKNFKRQQPEIVSRATTAHI